MKAKKLKVNLDEVAEAMEMHFDGETSWVLDTQTGEVIALASEFYDQDDEQDDDDELKRVLPAWQQNEAEQARRIANDTTGRFEEVPHADTAEAYRVMKDFVLQLPEGRFRDRLETAISGKGAFRRFKDELVNSAERPHWFDFETREKRKWALEWLESIGIESTWEPPAPLST